MTTCGLMLTHSSNRVGTMSSHPLGGQRMSLTKIGIAERHSPRGPVRFLRRMPGVQHPSAPDVQAPRAPPEGQAIGPDGQSRLGRHHGQPVTVVDVGIDPAPLQRRPQRFRRPHRRTGTAQDQPSRRQVRTHAPNRVIDAGLTLCPWRSKQSSRTRIRDRVDPRRPPIRPRRRLTYFHPLPPHEIDGCSVTTLDPLRLQRLTLTSSSAKTSTRLEEYAKSYRAGSSYEST